MNGDTGILAEELNADTQLLNMLNTFVSSQSCVLLLGPLFGIDQNKQKIHSNLRDFLTAPPRSLSLDDEFDNLYISTLTDGSQNSNLIYEIDNFYLNVTPSEVYEKILSIGFRAIISYTSDLLLEKANTKNEYDFGYFSAKGSQLTSESTQINNVSKKPIIYNIFGSVNDLNSLILDYDSLYDFLINILKADQEVPLQLKNILGSARAFLFLGFDLKKWYIPLIIRKFNQFILNGSRTRAAVSAFACLDDTPDAPTASFAESLNKYPLLFKPFKKMTSISLIDALAELPRKKTLVGSGPIPVNEREVNFFKKWRDDLKGMSVEQGLEDFFKAYRDLNYSGQFNKEFVLLSMQFNDLMLKKHAGMITEEDFTVSSNNIVDSVFDWMEKILDL
ncbi:hypothetical protein GZH53_07030 [Flavihumibacter sp. R14]|nr:hypothetical protein [Flavihumibacter soli]